jgi:hypothetical protein
VRLSDLIVGGRGDDQGKEGTTEMWGCNMQMNVEVNQAGESKSQRKTLSMIAFP